MTATELLNLWGGFTVNKIAFLFPGQGAQTLGMGKDLVENYPIAKKIMDDCNNILGYNLQEIMENGPKETLDQTENTQPAIVTISYVLSEILKEAGITAQGAAGLSLGEYSALVYGEVLSYKEALPLVKKRGQIMQKAVPIGVGGMVALVGSDIEKVKELLDNIEGGYIDVANYNCPGQYVVTGEMKAIDEVMEKAKSFGIRRAVKLDVSGPFHSRLLISAGEELGNEFKNVSFNEPKIDVYSNVTAKSYTSAEEVQELLVKQVSSSVLWEQTIENMIREGYTGFVEVGPQKTLSAMVKKISKDVWVQNVEDHATLQEFINFYNSL